MADSAKIMGLGKLERLAVGGVVGAALNSGVHFLVHGGQMIENTFDPQKALAALGAELGVSVLTGVLFKSAPAGFVSGLSALALFAIDMSVTRNPAAAVAAKPGAPATGLPAASQAKAATQSSASAQVLQAMSNPLTAVFNSIFGKSPTPAAAPQAAVAAKPGTSMPAANPAMPSTYGPDNTPRFVTSYDQIDPGQKMMPVTHDNPTFVTAADIYGPSAPVDNSYAEGGGEFITEYEGMAGARRGRRPVAVLGAVQSVQPQNMKVGNLHTWRPGKITTDDDVQQFNTYKTQYPKSSIPRRYKI